MSNDSFQDPDGGLIKYKDWSAAQLGSAWLPVKVLGQGGFGRATLFEYQPLRWKVDESGDPLSEARSSYGTVVPKFIVVKEVIGSDGVWSLANEAKYQALLAPRSSHFVKIYNACYDRATVEDQVGGVFNEGWQSLRSFVRHIPILQDEWTLEDHGTDNRGRTGRIISEFCDQGDLRKAEFFHRSPPSARHMISMLLQFAQAFTCMDRGDENPDVKAWDYPQILHKDIKPMNLFALRDPKKKVFVFKVADFGLATEYPRVMHAPPRPTWIGGILYPGVRRGDPTPRDSRCNIIEFLPVFQFLWENWIDELKAPETFHVQELLRYFQRYPREAWPDIFHKRLADMIKRLYNVDVLSSLAYYIEADPKPDWIFYEDYTPEPEVKVSPKLTRKRRRNQIWPPGFKCGVTPGISGLELMAELAEGLPKLGEDGRPAKRIDLDAPDQQYAKQAESVKWETYVINIVFEDEPDLRKEEIIIPLHTYRMNFTPMDIAQRIHNASLVKDASGISRAIPRPTFSQEIRVNGQLLEMFKPLQTYGFPSRTTFQIRSKGFVALHTGRKHMRSRRNRRRLHVLVRIRLVREMQDDILLSQWIYLGGWKRVTVLNLEDRLRLQFGRGENLVIYHINRRVITPDVLKMAPFFSHGHYGCVPGTVIQMVSLPPHGRREDDPSLRVRGLKWVVGGEGERVEFNDELFSWSSSDDDDGMEEWKDDAKTPIPFDSDEEGREDTWDGNEVDEDEEDDDDEAAAEAYERQSLVERVPQRRIFKQQGRHRWNPY